MTRDDVLRVIRRDFAGTPEADVLAMLDHYSKSDTVNGQSRVHLAIVKLSDSELNALRRHTDTACSDYRDVVSLAEYPEYSKHGFTKQFTAAERTAAIESDWKQYEQWLNKE